MIPPATPARILVIQFRGLGDIVLTTPLLDAIRRTWPAARVHLWTAEEAGRLFAEDPRVAEVLPRGRGAGLAASTARVLRGRYDLVLDPQSVPFTALVSRLAGRVSVGYRRRIRGAWYHRTADLRRHRGSGYSADHKLDLLRALGVPCHLRRPTLASPRRSGGTRLVVAPGSPLAYKRWDPARFAESVRRIQRGVDLSVDVVVGPGEENSLEAVRAALGGGASYHRVGRVEAWRDRLAGAALFLGNDGGVRHLAQALGVPTVGWFGSRDPRPWTMPDSPTDAVLVDDPETCPGLLAFPGTPRGAEDAARRVVRG